MEASPIPQPFPNPLSKPLYNPNIDLTFIYFSKRELVSYQTRFLALLQYQSKIPIWHGSHASIT